MALQAKNSITQRIATPKQGLSSLGTGKLWRAAAPLTLAVAALTGCVTAPQNTNGITQPTQTATPADKTRAKFYQDLNDELQRNAKTTGSILVMNPTGYDTASDFINASMRNLQNLVSPWNYDKHQSSPLYRIKDMLNDLANKGQNIPPQTINKSDGSQQTLSNIHIILAPISFHTTQNKQSYNYVCLSIGANDHVNLGTFSTLGTQSTMTPAFLQALNYADNNGASITLHEVGHCLNGMEERANKSILTHTVRNESTADAFEVLYRLSKGEPDMMTKIETLVQWRRLNVVVQKDVNHDTSQALRLVADDLRQNPEFGQSLAKLTLSELTAKAADYADRATIAQHPYLADKTLSTEQALARSIPTDMMIYQAQGFVAGLFLTPTYDNYPTELTAAQGLRILQFADTANNFLERPKHNQLFEGINKLREKFPAAMQEADNAFDFERARYPKLAAATPYTTTTLVSPQSASTQQTHKPKTTSIKPNHKTHIKAKHLPKPAH